MPLHLSPGSPDSFGPTEKEQVYGTFLTEISQVLNHNIRVPEVIDKITKT